MAIVKSVGDPLGKDNEPGSDANVDVKEYVKYIVESTKHWFYAPKNKYKDIAKSLGLKEVDPNSAKGEESTKLANGYGYIRLKARLKNGATMSLICDPEKVGSAITTAKSAGTASKKIYGVAVTHVYFPHKRILI